MEEGEEGEVGASSIHLVFGGVMGVCGYGLRAAVLLHKIADHARRHA